VLKAIDGVDMCVDEETRSIHYNKQDQYMKGDNHDIATQKVYPVGCYHMKYWEALDFARQRYSVAGGDYGRQRHQQQLLKAIFKKVLSRGTLTDGKVVGELRNAAGDLLTLDLGNTDVLDWVWTFKGLNSSSVVMVRTNGGVPCTEQGPIDKATGKPTSLGEKLTPNSMALFQSVLDDTVDSFLIQHKDWIAKDNDNTRPTGQCK
jgi:cell envelope-related transcriptional attenuator-like protein